MFRSLIDLVKRNPWLSLLVLIYAAAMIAMAWPKADLVTEDSDYYIFWQAGRDFASGNALYDAETDRPYYYPPFSGFVFLPMQLLPLKASALVFYLLNTLVFLPLSVYLVFRILRNAGLDVKKARLVVIFACILSLKYFWNNLVMFQVNTMLFLFMLLGIYFLSRKRPELAIVVFSIITYIKIIPVFLAAYVFFRHFSRKVILYLAVSALLCFAVPGMIRGFGSWIGDHTDYYHHFIENYIFEGKIVATGPNHSLDAGILKAFYPESRNMEDIYPDDFPVGIGISSVIQYAMILVLAFGGILLYRRKRDFSLGYLASILLFTHLFAGITWTAHLVSFLFILAPFLLIDFKKLGRTGKIIYWLVIAVFIFMGIEGLDTTGLVLYQMVRNYDVFTLILLGLFVFYTWMVWRRKSFGIFRENLDY